MALIPSESPSILVKEFDLSGVVPAVTSSTGAFVGDFNWGPADQPILVSTEAELASQFGSPSDDSAAAVSDFLSASMFLKYSSSAYVTRTVDDSAQNAIAAGADQVLIRNRADWDARSITTQNNYVIAKYPGTLGNSLKITMCPYSEGDSAFVNWTVDGVDISTLFDGPPRSSANVAGFGFAADSEVGDEVHVAIIDEDGKISGTPGTVLEKYEYLSLATDAKTDNGSTNFVQNVLNNKSEYVWAPNLSDAFPGITSAASFRGSQAARVANYSLDRGRAANPGINDYLISFGEYNDPDVIQVDFLVAPEISDSADCRTLVNSLTAQAVARKDCVVVTSPPAEIVTGRGSNTSVIASATANWANSLNASSYLIVDNNYLKVYDKYNDEYVNIPAAAATAGVMASTDLNADPWYSPAGSRRGQYFGVTSLVYNPSKSDRDVLYKASVNPIVNLPGQGILLYGDKTKLGRPSAFDRINVRRLFLVIERAIKGAAQNVMFEFNDEFTRAEFVNIVEPFLREIKGRRGITDFRVVCDETNNTPNIIDNNQFVASVFIKPARSINYVTLNFVAVRTGVDFDEVVGLV